MKKAFLIAGIVAAALVVGAGVFLAFYLTRPLSIYGQTVRANAREYTLTEAIDEPIDDVIRTLSQLRRLKKLDLGDYPVEVRDKIKLLRAFPNAELTYKSYVSLYGKYYEPDVEKLDLSDVDLSDLLPLRTALPFSTKLRTVRSTGNMLTRAELEKLRADFPEIEFDMISRVVVYGQELLDDAETLDLRDARLDDTLADQLARVPGLKEVDLRGRRFSTEEQLSLAAAFPEIAFHWEVTLLGRSYDSFIEDLDLSGDTGATPDLLREMAPLFPKSTRLDLSGCGLSERELAGLREDLPGVAVA